MTSKYAVERCAICGNTLHTPESKNDGIGPDCAKKVIEEVRKNEDADHTMYERGHGDDIVYLMPGDPPRIVGMPIRYIVRHSPTGLRWGYAGSGAAELALNLLIHFTGSFAVADRFYQQFKAEVLALIPPDGQGVVRRDEALNWLDHNISKDDLFKRGMIHPELFKAYPDDIDINSSHPEWGGGAKGRPIMVADGLEEAPIFVMFAPVGPDGDAQRDNAVTLVLDGSSDPRVLVRGRPMNLRGAMAEELSDVLARSIRDDESALTLDFLHAFGEFCASLTTTPIQYVTTDDN